MTEMNLKIEQYEGPLDLLLALITKHKIDIFDIPIHEIAQQYNEYLDAMQKMDMELAGEFLVMAAELMLIKSRMLLPRDESAEDPRKPLVDALLEHRRAQLAAELLKDRAALYYDRFSKPADEQTDPTYHREHAVALLNEAFARMAARMELEKLQKEEVKLFRDLKEERYYTVEEKLDELYARLKASPSVAFDSLFCSVHSRGEIVAIFLAVLEAVRFGQVDLRKDVKVDAEVDGEAAIWLSLSPDFEQPIKKSPL